MLLKHQRSRTMLAEKPSSGSSEATSRGSSRSEASHKWREKTSTKKKSVSAPARTLLHSMRSIWRTIVFLSLIMKYPFPTLKPMLVSPGRARAEDRATHLRQLLLQHPSTPISCTSIQKQHCHHSFSRCIHE